MWIGLVAWEGRRAARDLRGWSWVWKAPEKPEPSDDLVLEGIG